MRSHAVWRRRAVNVISRLSKPRIARYSSGQEIQRKYEQVTNVDYETYFETHTQDMNLKRTRYIRDRVRTEFLTTQRVPNNNYFEIGFGYGATVVDFAPFFRNLVLCEPNPLYTDYVRASLESLVNKQTTPIESYRFVDDPLDGEFDPDTYFTSLERKQGMGLIIAAQTLWYVEPESWGKVLDALFDSLSSNGVMVVSMIADDAASGSLYRAIEPRVQMANYVINHFEDKKKSVHNLDLAVWTDEYSDVFFERDAIEHILFYAQSVVACYGHKYESSNAFKELYWDTAADIYREAGMYTGKRCDDGNEMVQTKSIQKHIVVKKSSLSLHRS